jgi:hypothetical protein
MQQGFDFAPVDVAADRIMEDGAQQAAMLVAHGGAPFYVRPCSNYYPLWRQGKAKLNRFCAV